MSKILKFSEAATIGLHAATLLANSNSVPVTTQQIAAGLPVSSAHLSKVLQRLVKQGLVLSARGPSGGFALARASGSITLLEIFEAVDGPLETTHCLLWPPRCCGDCLLGSLLTNAARQVYNYLNSTTLAQAHPQALQLEQEAGGAKQRSVTKPKLSPGEDRLSAKPALAKHEQRPDSAKGTSKPKPGNGKASAGHGLAMSKRASR